MPDKPRLDIYPPPEMVDALDRWRGRQPGVPTRAEAARRLVEIALEAEGVRMAGKPARRQKAAAE
jgi:hypothetical protein